MSISYYDGSGWQGIDSIKRYTGGIWQECSMERKGSAEWETVFLDNRVYTKEYSITGYQHYSGSGRLQSDNINALISGNYISGGNPNAGVDTIIYLPLELMRRQLTGRTITQARLLLTRNPNSGNYFNCGAFFGTTVIGSETIDDSITTWNQQYVAAVSEHTIFSIGDTKYVELFPSAVERLLSGDADTLALVAVDPYKYGFSYSYMELLPNAKLYVSYTR